jgi:hypothetical protein
LTKPPKNLIYSGKLNEPIKWPFPSPIVTWEKVLHRKEGEELYNIEEFKEMYEEARMLVTLHKVQKLPLLFEHYKIDTKSNKPSKRQFMLLAIKLAEDSVPGFKVDLGERTNSAGRKKDTWPAWAKIALIRDVKELKEKLQLKTDILAIKELIKRANKRKFTLPIYAAVSRSSPETHVASLLNMLSSIRKSPEIVMQALMDEDDEAPTVKVYKNYFRNGFSL